MKSSLLLRIIAVVVILVGSVIWVFHSTPSIAESILQASIEVPHVAELQLYQSYDSGTESYIYSIVEYNGKLYAGTWPHGKVYVFDGTSFVEIYNTGTISVWSLASYGGKLFAGTSPGGKIFAYDGTSWGIMFDTLDSQVNSLAVYDGKLYAGTGSQGNIYVYDGTGWEIAVNVFSLVPNGIAYPNYLSHVLALTEYDGKLYAGTDVYPDTPGGASEEPGGLIFVFDGVTWSFAHDTEQEQVSSLAVYNGRLYAGTSPFGVIKVFDGISWAVSYDGAANSVKSLAVYQGNLYAGTSTTGIIYGFDGSTWAEAFDSPETALLSLITYSNSLYAGTYGDGLLYSLIPANDDSSAAVVFNSIAPFLETAYGFKTGEGIGGWTVYNPNWPSQANTLKTLNIGRGYWVKVGSACILQYGIRSYELNAGWNLIGWIPQL